MSFTAIWKNRNTPRVCSTNRCVSCYTTGHGIPDGMVQYATFIRVKNIDKRKNKYGAIQNFYTLRPLEYGSFMTKEEMKSLDIETGRVEPHFKNSIKFVQSRAARRRGYISTDYFYNEKAKDPTGENIYKGLDLL